VSQINHLREAIPVLSQLLFALVVPNMDANDATDATASTRVLCIDHDAASQVHFHVDFLLMLSQPISLVLISLSILIARLYACFRATSIYYHSIDVIACVCVRLASRAHFFFFTILGALGLVVPRCRAKWH